MFITRVEPISVARVAGVLHALVGLLAGCALAVVTLLGAAPRPGSEGSVPGLLFGLGAVFFMPVLLGGFGYAFSLLAAALYNLAARLTGGIEVQFDAWDANTGQGV